MLSDEKSAKSMSPNELFAEVERLRAQREAVLAIHRKKNGEHPIYAASDWPDGESEPVRWEPYTVCEGCSASPYPCRTVRALGVTE